MRQGLLVIALVVAGGFALQLDTSSAVASADAGDQLEAQRAEVQVAPLVDVGPTDIAVSQDSPCIQRCTAQHLTCTNRCMAMPNYSSTCFRGCDRKLQECNAACN